MPAAAERQDACVVRAELRDSRGRLVGRDRGEGLFSIVPAAGTD
jgi:hypothetical protein